MWNEYNAVQTELESLEEDEDVLNAYDKERNDVEKTYYRAKGTLLLHNRQPNHQPTQQRPQEPSHPLQVKLPDVKIPIFSGEHEGWMNFHDLFLSLVHSSATLSTIQKFYYLRSSLSGEALKLIQTIPISNEQYPVAWQTLVTHFQNPRRLKRTYVQSLFDFPCLKRETATELHTLIEKFQTNVKILKQLGENTEHWDVLLIHILSTRLDNVTRRDWEEYDEANQAVKFSQLIEFLQRRVNVLQTVGKGNVDTPQHIVSTKPVPFRSSNPGTVTKGFRGCIVCSGQHTLYQCSSFSQMSVSEKEQLVRRNQLCRNCLRRGHMAKDCSSESSCRKCQGRHHTQLCMQRSNQNSSASVAQAVEPLNQHDPPGQFSSNKAPHSSTPAAHTSITSCTSQKERRTKVLLATAMIILVDDVGNEHTARALLDSGSECCFVTERVSQRMKIQRARADLPIKGIGQSSTQVRFKIRSTVKSRISEYVNEIELLVLPKVTIDLPSLSVNASSWSLPPGIQLADPVFYESCPIDVVLGAEIFFDAFNVAGRIVLGDTLSCLINSVFGWVVSGKIDVQNERGTISCNLAATADLHRSIERFWAIEDDSGPAYSPQEVFCENHFCKHVTRLETGRISPIPHARGTIEP
ncbi:uncharacterized protein LOC129720263 [Wyeomyia smithii]|uniref:uncharacterized protein LOC129720263 n=1 Tax=Wyeomyia smithii TaxID=174621 RepID=UPI002467CEF6|nr:uncharacterized protein LOC129720263 [Wyeomyia smithii]